MNKELVYKKFFIGGIIILLILQVLSVIFFSLNFDDTEAMHAAWLLKQGLEPYRDFFEHHHSPYYYWLSIFLSEQSIIFVRLIQAVVHVFNIFLLYKIGQLAGLKKNQLILYIFLVLSTQAFIWTSIQVRPDSVMLLLALLGLYGYFYSLKEYNQDRAKAYGLIFLAGLAMGLSYLFLQKAVIIIASVGFLFIYDIFIKKRGLKMPIYFTAGLFLAISPYYLYLYSLDLLPLYWSLAYTFNLVMGISFSSKILMLVRIVKSLLIRNIFIWVLISVSLAVYLYKLIKYFKGSLDNNEDNQNEFTENMIKLLILALIQLAYYLFIVKAVWVQYLVLFVPLTLIFTSLFLYRQSRRLIVIFSLCVFFISSLNYVKWIVYRGGNMEISKYILNNTALNDKVYIHEDIQYHPIFRRDSDYCWFSQRLCLNKLGIPAVKQDQYLAHNLELHKPKAVYLDTTEYPRTKIVLEKEYLITQYDNLWLAK